MNRRLVFGAAILAAAAAAVLVSRVASPVDQASQPAIAPQPHPDEPAPASGPLLPLRTVLDEGRQKAQHPRAAVAQPSTPAPAAPSLGSVESAVHDVENANPQLGSFYALRTKALRTSGEQKQYRDQLSNRAMLAAARDGLLTAQRGGKEPMSQQGEIERILHIRYLSSVANMQAGDTRQDALNAMADVVLAELPAGLTSDARGSLLGDKVELYQYLLLNDRARADELMKRANGTPLVPVLLAAKGMIEPTDSAALPKK